MNSEHKNFTTSPGIAARIVTFDQAREMNVHIGFNVIMQTNTRKLLDWYL